MARRKLKKRVPALPAKTTMQLGRGKAEKLLQILREVALKNRSAGPQVFYPIRDVARHFGVPFSTVARVYNRLEEEGILVSVRGSKTLLQGSSSGRHLSVLGFLGMPACTPMFVTLQDYRTFFIRTRRELRARGFAVATMFFEEKDLQSGRLTSRIEKYDVDAILWHRPERSAKETLAQLKDSGSEIVGVSDGGFPPIRCRYEVQREAAIMSILHDWRATNRIKSVLLVRGVQASAQEEMLETLLEEQKLAHEFKSIGNQRPREFLDSLAAEKHPAIIFPPQAAALFAFRAPGSFTALMEHSRVALTGGPVSIPFAKVPEVAADLVVVDWQLVAEQIVTDLISRKAFDRADVTVFEAKAHLRAPLSQYAQSL